LDPSKGSLPTSAFAIGLNTASVKAAPSASRTSPNRTPSNRCENGTKIAMNTAMLNNPATTMSIPGP
jgi:hypothetical protein